MYCSIGFADSKPLVEDLSWMTGSWVGPAGPNTLEENWTEPVGASIASLVRMTGDGSTSMVEMIIIEEENDSLVLRIQQWNPGYIPRTPTPQTMELVSIEENRVKFRSTGEAGMATLMYSRPTPETFNIDIETAAGASFQLNLKAR
jgi:hypothetical protein